MHRYDGESWPKAIWRRAASHLWTERQIIVRSDGRVRYISVPRTAQAVGLLVGLGLAGWLGYASAVFMDFEQLVSGRDRMLNATENAYRGLVDEMSMSREKFIAMAHALDQQRAQLSRVIEQNETLKKSLAAVESQLSSVEGERKETKDSNAKLAGQVVRLEEHLGATEGNNAQLRTEIQATSQKLSSALGERTQIEKERDQLRNRVKDLDGRLAQVQTLQEGLMRRMSDATSKDIEAAEKLLAQVGISPNQVVKKPAARGGVGGPFIPARPGDQADPFGKAIASLLSNLERRDNLHGAVNSLPLGAPLASYTLGSSFGHRVDPFNGSAAYHQGVDLTAEKKTPVHSTGAGRVIGVTMDTRLGRMVEVDHGHNMVTRYGHLSANNVKVGQKVAKGDTLGLVGSTGRATGPHLHYEVLVNGQPVDPMRFMKAGKNVQKG